MRKPLITSNQNLSHANRWGNPCHTSVPGIHWSTIICSKSYLQILGGGLFLLGIPHDVKGFFGFFFLCVRINPFSVLLQRIDLCTERKGGFSSEVLDQNCLKSDSFKLWAFVCFSFS